MFIKITTEPQKYISEKIVKDIRESFRRITRAGTAETLKQMQFPIDLASGTECTAVQRYGQLSIYISYSAEYNYPEDRLKADCDLVFDWVRKNLIPHSYYKYKGMLEVSLNVPVGDGHVVGARRWCNFIV